MQGLLETNGNMWKTTLFKASLLAQQASYKRRMQCAYRAYIKKNTGIPTFIQENVNTSKIFS